ncbi:MAG: hypothetical protein AAGJ82_13870 [Bacteroidota bacterium]
MKQVLRTYTPTSNDQLYLYLGIALAVLMGGLCYWLLQRGGDKGQRTNRIILAMLAFFVGMMAMATAFFSGWNLQKQGKVELYAEQLVIGSAVIPFDQIRNIAMRRDGGNSMLGITDDATVSVVLLIERRDGRTFALSSQHYPVNEIATELKELTESAAD